MPEIGQTAALKFLHEALSQDARRFHRHYCSV